MRYRYIGAGGEIFPALTAVVPGGEPSPGDEIDVTFPVNHPHWQPLGDGSVAEAPPAPLPDPGLEAPKAEESRIEAEIAAAESAAAEAEPPKEG
jgi:hypothetical protein